MTAIVFVIFLGVSQVFSQGQGTQPRPQAPATQAKPKAPTTPVTSVPVSKIAVIYSEEFQNPKTGIARFIALITRLNGEFQKVQNELTQTAQRLKQLQDEITNLQRGAAVVPPAQIQAKIDQLDQLKKDYQRKGEDAQAAYQKRRQELLGPLQDDVGKALDTYAKGHAITMIIDGSQVQGIIYAAESIDITRLFISDYNSKNPATASVAPPK